MKRFKKILRFTLIFQLNDKYKNTFKKGWDIAITHNNNKYTLTIPVEDLANIETWDEQRSIQKDHLNELRNDTESYKDLDYGYHIAELVIPDDYTGDTVRKNVLIDGQHRRHVRCYNEDGSMRKFGIDEYVSVMYYPNRLRQEICELFRNINKSRPILFKDTTYKYQELLSKCQRAWPNAFMTADSTKRPRITTGTFSKLLKKTNIFKDGDEGMTVNEVFDKIKSINEEEKIHILLSDDVTIKKLYKLSIGTINKVEKDCNGFYLGIDEKYKWVKGIC
jgi:hypothetical protein